MFLSFGLYIYIRYNLRTDAEMGKLKPIGSEKLQGLEKINRILEIARYKENIPSNLNETSRVEFALAALVAPDGNRDRSRDKPPKLPPRDSNIYSTNRAPKVLTRVIH